MSRYGNSPGMPDERGHLLIDLRSDTVTRPSAAMREAMATAAVGDDVYGEDPTIIELETRVAGLLGKEAGLFVSSGTQSNLTALLTHCGRGDEYIAGNCYHVALHEAGGAAVLGGISPLHLAVDDRGGLTAGQIDHAIKPEDVHFARSRLVCLENTVNGRVQDQAEINAMAKLAHERGLLVHLDGARLMNAAVASNHSPAELVAEVDSVSLCLSKGLGAPAGSVLCGDAEFIRRARHNRKLLGGGMRQAGILAAGGLYAIDNNIERLAEDHRRARRLAEALADIPALEVDTAGTDTNMVFVGNPGAQFKALQQHLFDRNIVVGDPHPDLRLVMHLDIDDDGLEQTIDAFASFFR